MVKLPTTTVKRLSSPFDENELTEECGIQAIIKTSVKTLQIGLYSFFLNVTIKHIQEKEKEKKLTVKEK